MTHFSAESSCSAVLCPCSQGQGRTEIDTVVGFVESITVTTVEGQITPSIVQQEFPAYLPNTLEILPYPDDDADDVTHSDVTDTVDDSSAVVTQEPDQEPDEEGTNVSYVMELSCPCVHDAH